MAWPELKWWQVRYIDVRHWHSIRHPVHWSSIFHKWSCHSIAIRFNWIFAPNKIIHRQRNWYTKMSGTSKNPLAVDTLSRSIDIGYHHFGYYISMNNYTRTDVQHPNICNKTCFKRLFVLHDNLSFAINVNNNIEMERHGNPMIDPDVYRCGFVYVSNLECQRGK